MYFHCREFRWGMEMSGEGLPRDAVMVPDLLSWKGISRPLKVKDERVEGAPPMISRGVVVVFRSPVRESLLPERFAVRTR
jgi:hypothetical protein